MSDQDQDQEQTTDSIVFKVAQEMNRRLAESFAALAESDPDLNPHLAQKIREELDEKTRKVMAMTPEEYADHIEAEQRAERAQYLLREIERCKRRVHNAEQALSYVQQAFKEEGFCD